MGFIFAHDQRQYDKWHRSTKRKASRGLTGDALEAAVMNLAAQFPENVVRGVMPSGAA